eukprot:scaffold37690_cov128-Skeletonema_marinoi.AAC.1
MKFISSILTLLLAAPVVATTTTRNAKSLKSADSDSSICEGEDEVLKAAVVATIVRKVQSALGPFHEGTTVSNGELVGQAFMEKLIAFDNEEGNGNGEMEPREIIIVLPDAPPAGPGDLGGLPAALLATMGAGP